MTRKEMPPNWALKFLRVICPAHLAEEIEGDLLQKFERDKATLGLTQARRRFAFNTLKFFRPGIVLRNKLHLELITLYMIPYYLRIAWRDITGSKFYSALNLLGLTLGLTVGLLILLWVNNEISYDAFHSKANTIYRINLHLESNGEKFAVRVSPASIGPIALREIPGVRDIVRITDLDNWASFRSKGAALKANAMYFVDPSFTKIFDFKMIRGDREKPFPNVNSVILTQSEAKRFFGNEDPVGKILTADNGDNFTVSGVMDDFPENSSFNASMLFSTALRKNIYLEQGRGEMDSDWGNIGWNTFFELDPGVSIEEVAAKLTKINVNHQPNIKAVDAGFYTLQPLKNIHLYAENGNPVGLKAVRTFSSVAILILVIAAINYINLGTARALQRSKEVSVRKVIGATRKQLFFQFIVQTLLFFSIALFIAFLLMIVAMPIYNSISGKELQFNPMDFMLWRIVGLTLFIILMAASIYPAILLSSFQPAQVLKGKFGGVHGGNIFRKILVVGQFAFSIGLIICTMIVGRQLSFVLEGDLGIDKDHVFTVQMSNMLPHYETIRAALLSNPSIEGVTSGAGNIIARYGATLDVDWDGKDPNGSFFVHDLIVDKDFIPMFKMEMTSGNSFTGSKTDSMHFILNETAVKQAGIKDPIGKRFRWHSTEGTIIGVAKDFHFVALKNPIQPFVFAYSPSNWMLYVKASGSHLSEAVETVQKYWTTYNPDAPFDWTFVDHSYHRQYESDLRLGGLFRLFTVIAIVISCLGLLGLVTYTAQTKVKEIGIRKVLGASINSIVIMLSKNFLTLVFVAMVIAIPSAYLISNNWLNEFAYKIGIPWWVYALSSGVAIGMAILTIGFQCIRAAIENPVSSLKE